ncbi:MAG: hypothetical protein MI724_08230, partial [Spirochaetales bacterium]|nr:hypothetical protein [Spirochaetales bacterium]
MKLLNRTIICVALLAAPLTIVTAGGASEADAPTLDLPSQPRQFISPANQDGAQDVLQLPFSEVVASAENRAIVEYALTVYDTAGTLVFSATAREDERIGFFGNLFGGERPQVEIPDTLTWDGTWSLPDDLLPDGVSNGDPVEDGEYAYQLTIIDDAGRFARSAPFAVTVDNTAPTIDEFQPLPFTVFSPNDDGVRDEVEVPLNGSREFSWTVEIVDEAGQAVYTAEFINDSARVDRDAPPPSPFRWDGRVGTADEPGDIASEAQYRLVLTGVDRAGNATVAEHPSVITLSLQEADLTVRVADGNAAFSPNGDARRDTITLELASTSADAIRDWRLDILNGEQVVRSDAGAGPFPSTWVFDGLRADGSILPDGSVAARLEVNLDNGNRVVSEPLPILIDTRAPEAILLGDTAPQGTESGRPLVFGVGEKQRLIGTLLYDSDVSWTFSLGQNGRVIASGALEDFFARFDIESRATADGMQRSVNLVWDGQAVDGAGRAPDGLYELSLNAEDLAGNRGESRPLRVIKDGRTPEVDLALDGEYLSPLTEGAIQSVTFRTTYGAGELIEEFLFEVRDRQGRMVRSSYQREPFDRFEWNGLSNGGTIVPDGTYSATLRVIYQNGHVGEVSNVGPIIVDRTRPRINRLAVDPRSFSPDGDGEDDTVLVEQDVEPEDNWTGVLFNAAGEVLARLDWGETVESFRWDGRDEEGRLLPDGDYRYVLSATDRAGNTTSEDLLVTIGEMALVASGADVQFLIIPQPFSPDGDGVDDIVTIGVAFPSGMEIARWEGAIRDPMGRPFRSASGTGSPPRTVEWDGRGDNGELVQSAMDYSVEIVAFDVDGNEIRGQANIATDILVIRDGDRLRIRISNILFAPNTPDLFLSDRSQLDTNLDTLRRLAQILNRYPEREIVIEGHAAHVFLQDPEQRLEQEQVLLPLSRARATEVMQALIILGVDR